MPANGIFIDSRTHLERPMISPLIKENTMRFVLLFLCVANIAVAAEKPTGEFEGYKGWWLKNERSEAFVIADPYPRIIAFRLNGGNSPLHVSHDYEYFGIRTWFLEPTQNSQSPLPALQKASVEKMGENGLRLVAVEKDSSALELTMEIRLDDSKPILHVRHGMKNLRDEKRRIALWALNVIKADGGVGITPWRADGRQTFLFWPDTDPDEEGIHLGAKALALDYRVLPRNGWLKVGTDTDAGWVAYVFDGYALKSTVPFVAKAEYPEGGGSITMFNSTSAVFDGNPRFGEIENVGPLSDLMPGNTLWMEQKLEIVSGLEGDDPEMWIDLLEKE